jgi:streptomycin 6-kinase
VTDDPRIAQALQWMARWDCAPDGPFFTTDDGFLWPVRQGAAPLMLKIADGKDDEAQAWAVLAQLDGRHAVRLIRQAGHVTLMERVIHSGPTLEQMALTGADDAATRVLCQVTRAMQGALADMSPATLIPFDVRVAFLAEVAQGDPFHRWAADFAQGMAQDSRPDWRPLHGDMHHFNVLHDARRGWLAIDPKGILGPPAYDYANILLNPFPHADHVLDPARLSRQAAIAAEIAGVPESDMLRWVCLHGCLGAAWSLRDDAYAYWREGAEIAGRLADLPLP